MALDRQATIDAIRDYAIECTARAPSASTVDEALDHFGLQPYRPRYRVFLTVTGAVELTADSPEQAAARARQLLQGLAWSGDQPDDEMETVPGHVHVDDVEPALT